MLVTAKASCNCRTSKANETLDEPRCIHLEDTPGDFIDSSKWIGEKKRGQIIPAVYRKYRLPFRALTAGSYTRKKAPIPVNKRPADDLAHIPRRALDRLLRVPVPRPSMIVL